MKVNETYFQKLSLQTEEISGFMANDATMYRGSQVEIYTDGSKDGIRTDAAVAAPDSIKTVRLPDKAATVNFFYKWLYREMSFTDVKKRCNIVCC